MIIITAKNLLVDNSSLNCSFIRIANPTSILSQDIATLTCRSFANYNIGIGIFSPLSWFEKLNYNSITIQGSILLIESVNHDIYIDGVNGDESSPSIVLVDSNDTFEQGTI